MAVPFSLPWLFSWSTRAALMNGYSEALWKLGDLYASGKGVPRDSRMAWTMYCRARENAQGLPFGCRAYLSRPCEG